MDLTKLIAMGGAGGASFASGSLLSGSGLQSMSVSLRHEPLMNPYQDFDLACVKSTFEDKIYQKEKLKQAVTKSMTISSYSLDGPSSTTVTGDVKGCFKAALSQIEKTGSATKLMGVTMEMAISRGKYGIILMNHIANVKDYGVRMNTLRAIFLENNGTWWVIKGAIQWSDDTFLNKVSSSQSLKWNGLGRSEEIIWESSSENSEPLKKVPLSHSWKNDNSKDKNVYQELNITGQPSGQAEANHSFWSRNAEPVTTAPKLSAVFKNEMWIEAPDNADASKAKEWFNLFKDQKGTWGNS